MGLRKHLRCGGQNQGRALRSKRPHSHLGSDHLDAASMSPRVVFDYELDFDIGMALAPHQDTTEYGGIVA